METTIDHEALAIQAQRMWNAAQAVGEQHGNLRVATHYLISEGVYGPGIALYSLREAGGKWDSTMPLARFWANQAPDLVSLIGADLTKLDVRARQEGTSVTSDQLEWANVANIVHPLSEPLWFVIWRQPRGDSEMIKYANRWHGALPYPINTQLHSEMLANANTIMTGYLRSYGADTDMHLVREVTHYAVRDVGEFDTEGDFQKSTLVIDFFNVMPISNKGFAHERREAGLWLDGQAINPLLSVQLAAAGVSAEFKEVIDNAFLGQWESIKVDGTGSTPPSLNVVMKAGKLHPIGCTLFLSGTYYTNKEGQEVWSAVGVQDATPYDSWYLDKVQKVFDEFGGKRPVANKNNPPELKEDEELFQAISMDDLLIEQMQKFSKRPPRTEISRKHLEGIIKVMKDNFGDEFTAMMSNADDIAAVAGKMLNLYDAYVSAVGAETDKDKKKGAGINAIKMMLPNL